MVRMSLAQHKSDTASEEQSNIIEFKIVIPELCQLYSWLEYCSTYLQKEKRTFLLRSPFNHLQTEKISVIFMHDNFLHIIEYCVTCMKIRNLTLMYLIIATWGKLKTRWNILEMPMVYKICHVYLVFSALLNVTSLKTT